MKTGLFIGRFQPLHLGHMSAIEKALREVDFLAIGIGSSQLKMKPENPFSLNERIKMVENSVSGNYKIFPVTDINNDDTWVKHVENCAKKKDISKFDVIYSNNPLVIRLFKESGYAVKKIPILVKINSTTIRKLMAAGKDWKKYVPTETENIIKNIRGDERVKNIYRYVKNA